MKNIRILMLAILGLMGANLFSASTIFGDMGIRGAISNYEDARNKFVNNVNKEENRAKALAALGNIKNSSFTHSTPSKIFLISRRFILGPTRQPLSLTNSDAELTDALIKTVDGMALQFVASSVPKPGEFSDKKKQEFKDKLPDLKARVVELQNEEKAKSFDEKLNGIIAGLTESLNRQDSKTEAQFKIDNVQLLEDIITRLEHYPKAQPFIKPTYRKQIIELYEKNLKKFQE